MSPVYTAYDPITVSGRALNYVNTLTDTLVLNQFFISFIPVNLFNVFKNIKTFQLLNSSTTVLTTDSFVNCATLRNIYIHYGIVTNIPEGFAQTCTNIYDISISYSNVEAVHKNAFKNLGNLMAVCLIGNKISCIHADTFLPTPLLIYIYLQNNQINAIDKGFVRTLSKLVMLDMTNNLIKYLPTLTLINAELCGLAILLFGNPINAIKPDFCTAFRNTDFCEDTYTSFDYKDANGKRLSWWSDVVYFKDLLHQNGIPCLVPGITFNNVTQLSCASFNNALKTCYANYNAAMPDTYPCESSCGSNVVLSKVKEFLKLILKAF